MEFDFVNLFYLFGKISSIDIIHTSRDTMYIMLIIRSFSDNISQ